MDLIKTFTSVRHYIDWDQLEATEGNYAFNPTHKGGWNYDAIYERCKSEGIFILPCLKNTPDWIYNTFTLGGVDTDNLPLVAGSDRALPKSYIAMAKIGFQLASRYGANKNVDTSLVKVNTKERWASDGHNEKKIGLNLIKYIECNNEPDKWWKGKRAQFSPAEYAASLSAFYDGHKGTLGKGVGVKVADPSIKVVLGGLAKPDVQYVKDIVEWCKKNRGYHKDGSVNLCFDVINFHMYSNQNPGGVLKYVSKKRGSAPELTKMGEIADSFINYATLLGKQIEVWSTELGYSLDPNSLQKSIAIGDKSPALTEGDWILRSSFLYARHGLDKIFFYQLFDADDTQAGANTFSKSGLSDGKKRRPAADYLLQTNKLIGEYSYVETLNSDPIVDVYSLGNKKMHVLYIPDEVGRTEEFELNLKGAKKAKIYMLKVEANEMESKIVKVENGVLKLNITETPVFVEAI
ncbi:MAG: hypothetical protein EOO93_17450 [Pedobacter sp.]|nr:MAG: hypothetical protein EOO93_17450 [Pedobacter sp.]